MVEEPKYFARDLSIQRLVHVYWECFLLSKWNLLCSVTWLGLVDQEISSRY